ncbi:3-oxoacyl-[acyl-carrier-protein] synthase 1 [compost metagenome]
MNRNGADFPYINSLKSLTGHCLSASGSVESVAAILQLHEEFLFGNINCSDLHPEISALIDPSKVLLKTIKFNPKIIAKASFGFGDVNACLLFKKFEN